MGIEKKEDTYITVEESKLIPETVNRKEKTDIDVLLEADKQLLLIVEDNSDVRKYIIGHLEDDYRIRDAVDGEDGLNEALRTGRYRLLVGLYRLDTGERLPASGPEGPLPDYAVEIK